MIQKVIFKNIVEKILSPSEEIRFQFSLGEKYLKIMKIVIILIGSVLLLAIALSLYHIFELTLIIVVLIIGVSLALVIGITHFYYGWFLIRSNIYVVTNKRIIIHKGWLFTDLKSVSFQQITDIRVIQSFVDKMLFNTGILKINTAGRDDYEVILHHIENPHKVKTKIVEIRHFLSEKKEN